MRLASPIERYARPGRLIQYVAVAAGNSEYSIPEGVTSIGTWSFSDCTSLSSVEIPEGVTSIWPTAFKGCTSLASVSIPSTMTYIYYSAFNGCTFLSDVYYAGSEADRAAMTINSSGNDCLINATWHYGSAPVKELTAAASTDQVVMGRTATLACEVEGLGDATATYQWQYSANGGATWLNSPAAGATTASLSLIANATRAKNLYRCVVMSSDGREATTDAIALDIAKLEATSSTTAVKCGYKATFRCAVSGKGTSTVSYQWQYSTNGGQKWTNVTATGAKTAAYSVVANAARANNLWRCVVTASDGRTATTGPIGIKVSLKVTVATSPVAAGSLQSFVSTTSGYGSCSFTRQWQVSKDGGETWAASTASTATAKTLKVTATKARAQAGWLYRCVVTAGGFTAASDALALQVK